MFSLWVNFVLYIDSLGCLYLFSAKIFSKVLLSNANKFLLKEVEVLIWMSTWIKFSVKCSVAGVRIRWVYLLQRGKTYPLKRGVLGIVGALWGVVARTCFILLATSWCSCRLASFRAVLLASRWCIHTAVSTRPLPGRNCVTYYRSGLISIWPIAYR